MSKKKEQTCQWLYYEETEYGDCYNTFCGEAFVLTDGKLSDHRMNFCCYCGKKLVEVKHGK